MKTETEKLKEELEQKNEIIRQLKGLIDFCVQPEKPKRMVKKTIDVWVNIYADGNNYSYFSEARAKDRAAPECIAVAVHCIGEYEVKE